MKIDISLEDIQLIVEDNFLHFINEQYGKQSLDSFKVFVETIRNVYSFINLHEFKKITLFYQLYNTKIPLSNNYKITNLDQINYYARSNEIIIDATNRSSLKIWNNETLNINKIRKNVIIYQIDKGIETFYGKKVQKNLKKLESIESYFSPKTYKDLTEALHEYKITQVNLSPCKILEKMWVDKENRIFLIRKPESIMRNSLTQFLKSYLRNTKEVRPEQIVDESHPVDIKVTWLMTNKLALIEIKWLGKSFCKIKKKVTVKYYDNRALEGAKQLVEYIDANYKHTPIQITRGYLVIIDARRRTADKMQKAIDEKNGLYYENKEIKYKPEYHKTRKDFEEPIRMFVKPVCTI